MDRPHPEILAHRARSAPLHPQRGMSLVELMIALALGAIITVVMLALFIGNQRTQQEIFKTNQQIENGRYATDLLAADLRMAGYFGEFNPGALVTPTALPDPTQIAVANLAEAIALPVQGYDEGAGMPPALVTLLADLRAGTDVLVLRRTSSCTAGLAGCEAVDMTRRTYFQTTLCNNQLSVLTPTNQFLIGRTSDPFFTNNPAVTGSATPPQFLARKDCTTPAVLRSLVTHIYFVTNNHLSGDGIPTLRMAEMGATGYTVTPMVEGVDQLQFEYGRDTNADGTVDGYFASPATPIEWRQVTAVKIHLLARNSQVSAGFNDSRTYTLGTWADGTERTSGPYNDAFKRHAYTTVLRLNNIAGRLE